MKVKPFHLETNQIKLTIMSVTTKNNNPAQKERIAHIPTLFITNNSPVTDKYFDIIGLQAMKDFQFQLGVAIKHAQTFGEKI